ncbi:helix-turn-helix domain-containing protein [Nocardioides bigeumensis]|uniref:Helix-turn-helix domain-containing protein n=1 Tax=Nocardioides bigeumensis TaxID=433657 RepID=A0ABP5J7R4_9ACTN
MPKKTPPLPTAPPISRRRLISVPEAADYCGVDVKTMRRWINDGRLNAYDLGPRVVRVDLEELHATLLRPKTIRDAR